MQMKNPGQQVNENYQLFLSLLNLSLFQTKYVYCRHKDKLELKHIIVYFWMDGLLVSNMISFCKYMFFTAPFFKKKYEDLRLT